MRLKLSPATCSTFCSGPKTCFYDRDGSWNYSIYSSRFFVYLLWNHFDGLVQDCSNSIANAVELLQSCTKPLISLFLYQVTATSAWGIVLVRKWTTVASLFTSQLPTKGVEGWVCWRIQFTLKWLGHLKKKNVISFSDALHLMCNIFIWNWSNTMNVLSALFPGV